MGQKADILMCAMAVLATVRMFTDAGMGAASDRFRPWSGLVWPHAQGPERKKSHALQDVASWFNAGVIALPSGIGRAALQTRFPRQAYQFMRKPSLALMAWLSPKSCTLVRASSSP